MSNLYVNISYMQDLFTSKGTPQHRMNEQITILGMFSTEHVFLNYKSRITSIFIPSMANLNNEGVVIIV